MTILEAAALFVEWFRLPGTVEQIAAELNAVMDGHYQRDIPLKAGALDYVSRLHRRGVRMCVASATAPELMQACLQRAGADGYFDFLLSCEQVGAGKHQPQVYLKAARRLQAPPEQIAVVEDALYAARTAKEAGFYTVAVYDDSGKTEWEELTALADETIFDWPAAAPTL